MWDSRDVWCSAFTCSLCDFLCDFSIYFSVASQLLLSCFSVDNDLIFHAKHTTTHLNPRLACTNIDTCALGSLVAHKLSIRNKKKKKYRGEYEWATAGTSRPLFHYLQVLNSKHLATERDYKCRSPVSVLARGGSSVAMTNVFGYSLCKSISIFLSLSLFFCLERQSRRRLS